MIYRRELLQLGAASAAAAALAKTAFAQPAPAAAAAPAPAAKFALDAYSRNLQWCRTPQELAKAVSDIGLGSVDLTVAAYPGHVDPAKAKTDLPTFANALKQGGISVSSITCGIVDADTPNAEAILDAASSAGIHNYSWGGFTYAAGQPYAKQLDALKPRIAKLAKLNEKYGMKALYQPKAGPINVGSAFLDFLPVLQGFDSRFVAFRYDTAALLQASPQTTVMHLQLAGPYIGAMAINDAVSSLDLPVWEEGAFDDAPEMLTLPSGGGDNNGTAGGDPLAIGGGGNPLPYRIHSVQVGTGMVDLTSLGKALKDINFNGPAECQINWPLGGAEAGSDKIALPRQQVIGLIKRDRLIVEQGFQKPWNIDVAAPPFMKPSAAAAGGRGGRGGAAGGGGPDL